jgi:carbonic anhydrase
MDDDESKPKSQPYNPFEEAGEARRIVHDELLAGNRRWVERTLKENPNYFEEHSESQRPTFLWIGCADSRVPANVVTDTKVGEVFVHRNIANVVIHTDFNVMSVLQYAVDQLKVQHVIVCGHYGCGGVAAALSSHDFGLMNKWLRHIKDVARAHDTELRAYTDRKTAERRLVELNVIEQVYNLAQTAIVQRAWKDGRSVELHGWVYDMADGRIRDLGVNFKSAEVLDKYYRYDFE